jgi:hypothetical protein
MNLVDTGYGPMIGRSKEGHPIYIYTNPRSRSVHYVVVLPDGNAYLSDADGQIGTTPEESPAELAGAMVAGAGGLLLGGPVAGIIGAIVGAIVGNQIKKRAA